MPHNEIAWELMRENTAKLDGMCVLCYHGIPGGSGTPGPPHHIHPKQMGGTKNEFVLKDKRNIAPACPPHHDKYQPDRAIWVEHMSKPPLSYNYENTPLAYCVEEKADDIQAMETSLGR